MRISDWSSDVSSSDLGWTFPWVSSQGNDFNFDFGVSFTRRDIAAGRAIYNYGTPIKSSEDMHGTSIFAKNENGEVFHTYSTYACGDETLMGAFSWLDLTPKGRNAGDGIMSWLKLHDEYEAGRWDTRRVGNGCVSQGRTWWWR